MTFPKKVRIRELGPREGFQTISKTIPTAQKIELIERLSKTGVKDIEITSFVKPDKVPQMADAEEVVKGVKQAPGINYSALYLNIEGYERGERTGVLHNEGWLYTAASETFLKKNNNRTLEQVAAEIPKWLEAFSKTKKRVYGLMVSTAFGCNYEGAVSHEKVIHVIRNSSKPIELSGGHFEEISLADTMGWASPEKLKQLIRLVRKEFPRSNVTLHLHDTRGTGIANVYAGLVEGVSVFDASVGGMGGCPFAKGAAGNVATEDVVYLCHELGIETGIDLERYVEAAVFAESIIGAPLPGKLYRAWKYGKV